MLSRSDGPWPGALLGRACWSLSAALGATSLGGLGSLGDLRLRRLDAEQVLHEVVPAPTHHPRVVRAFPPPAPGQGKGYTDPFDQFKKKRPG